MTTAILALGWLGLALVVVWMVFQPRAKPRVRPYQDEEQP